MINSFTSGTETNYNLYSSLSTLTEIKKDYPEVESVVGMHLNRDMSIKFKEKQTIKNVISFNGDFINIFTPNFIYGDSLSFNQITNPCLITKSFYNKNLFKRNPIGEILILQNNNDSVQVVIAGVIDDFQNTTCIQGNIFVKTNNELNLQDGFAAQAFILLNEKNKIKNLNNIPAKKDEYNGVKYEEGFFFQPINEVYLKSDFLNFNFYPSGNLKLIIVFFTALLLMLLCIIFNYNFMFIIHAKQRIREYSIKRIFGVKKSKVLYGIISDNIIFITIAACISYVLCIKVYSSIDSLNLVLKDYIHWFDNIFAITFFIVFIITITIPLFYYKSILRYRRLDRLKISNSSNNKKAFGNIFLGVQIIVAFILIAFSLIINSQLQFAINRDIGIKNRKLIIMENDITDQEFDLFSQEIKKIPNVSNITRIGSVPPSNMPQGMIRVKSLSQEKDIVTAMLFVHQNTLETLDVTYIQGEGFENYNNFEACCVVSESLAKQIGIDNVIGHKVISDWEIVGVVKDISLAPVQKENYPLLIICKPKMCRQIIINYSTNTETIGKEIASVYENLFGKSSNITFYEDHLKSLYKEENFMLRYMTTFSILTLILVFFGFYFYARSTVDLRSKEIVIRKINGATTQDIIKLLTKEYLVVSLISIFIASVACIYLTNIWLSGFNLHINIGLIHFLYPIILILLILVFAVINNALRLARENIITSLDNYR